MSERKERPILFNGAMVREILEGRKTQTRRVVKPKHRGEIIAPGGPAIALEMIGESHIRTVICPYGEVGDRLWVREAFSEISLIGSPLPVLKTIYRADDPDPCPWRPSIHMPRGASRILLEITGVRVERLQNLSESDAKAEGADGLMSKNCTEQSKALLDLPLYDNDNPYRNGYALLWESINGTGSWDVNPWVWVVEFKRCQA